MQPLNKRLFIPFIEYTPSIEEIITAELTKNLAEEIDREIILNLMNMGASGATHADEVAEDLYVDSYKSGRGVRRERRRKERGVK